MDLTLLDRYLADVSGLMLSDLRELDLQLAAAAADVKRRKDALHAIMARRFEEEARKQLTASGKDTGTVNLQTNGINVKVMFAKKVEWDQDELMKAANKMQAQDAKHYVKIELKVDERKFTAAPPAIQAVLAPARTVKVEKPKFSFSVEDAEAA